MKNIGILHYGTTGNIQSIFKAIEMAGGKPCFIEKAKDFDSVDSIVLPGVGNFKSFMQKLNESEITPILVDNIRRKPTLGICLGMQILSTYGFEDGKTGGLGLINAEAKPLIVGAEVPHMGFNKLKVINASPILRGVEDELFYFMHSFEVVNYTNITSLTEYTGHEFVSSVRSEHVFGVQFHPEKSREAGITVFKNFIEYEG